MGWLFVACLPVMAADLPWTLRASLCLAFFGSNLPVLSRLVLLRGQSAIRWIEWQPDGRLRIGPMGECEDAILDPGAFRLGFAFFLLWFTTSGATRGVLIDGRLQDPAAFRRLGRRLKLLPSRPKV